METIVSIFTGSGRPRSACLRFTQPANHQKLRSETTLQRLVISGFSCNPISGHYAVGDTFHVFDLLEVDGDDLRSHRYIDRHSSLLRLLPLGQPALLWVSTAIDPNDKVETYEELRLTGAEGIVFKDINAPNSPGPDGSRGGRATSF